MREVLKGKVQMRTVKVKRDELLSKVRANREKHIQEYKDACDGYKDEALAAVKQGFTSLEKRIQQLEAGEVIALAAVSFNLNVPQSHEQSYNQVIAMLEMSVDEVLEIQSDEFACYVMDDWDWRQSFEATKMRYTNNR